MGVGGNIFTSMEASGSFHGNTCNFPLSMEVEAKIASINCSFHEYIPWKLPWASIYPYILLPYTNTTNFQLLPQDFHKGPPTSIRSTSLDVSTNFQRSSMEVKKEVDLLPWKLSDASMEVHGSGSFHRFHQVQLQGIYSVTTSTSVLIPLHTSTYFHECHKLPAASTSISLTLTLTLGGSYLRESRSTSSFVKKMWKLPWKPMEVYEGFHWSRWCQWMKLFPVVATEVNRSEWTSMEVNLICFYAIY